MVIGRSTNTARTACRLRCRRLMCVQGEVPSGTAAFALLLPTDNFRVGLLPAVTTSVKCANKTALLFVAFVTEVGHVWPSLSAFVITFARRISGSETSNRRCRSYRQSDAGSSRIGHPRSVSSKYVSAARRRTCLRILTRRPSPSSGFSELAVDEGLQGGIVLRRIYIRTRRVDFCTFGNTLWQAAGRDVVDVDSAPLRIPRALHE